MGIFSHELDVNHDGTAAQEIVSAHPLIATYPTWLGDRLHKQTKTTMNAIHDAINEGDVELLEAFDRLLSDSGKGGAWIKYVVKSVRKKPELGTVAGITVNQLHAYLDMRIAVNATVFGKGTRKHPKQFDKNIERDRTPEFELFDFAIAFPDEVPEVIGLINRRGLLDLTSIRELLVEINSSHAAISVGAL